MAKVNFRKAQKQDAVFIQAFWADPRVMTPVGFPDGLKKTQAQIAATFASYDRPDRAFLMILDEHEQVIGEFCYEQIDATTFQFDIKIGIFEKQGQGYGEAAVRKGLGLIFERFEPEQIKLEVSADNRPALNLYHKVGFETVRRLENSWVDQKNHNRDSFEMILSQTTWRKNTDF